MVFGRFHRRSHCSLRAEVILTDTLDVACHEVCLTLLVAVNIDDGGRIDRALHNIKFKGLQVLPAFVATLPDLHAVARPLCKLNENK